ncbi:MAG TPA: hypothetical protein PLZ67_04430, partial [Bacteroidales bacterium]|nr:hypothetical protein [Bacteroidales bacterium]
MFDVITRESVSDVRQQHVVLMNRYMPELLKNISPMVMVLTRNFSHFYVIGRPIFSIRSVVR